MDFPRNDQDLIDLIGGTGRLEGMIMPDLHIGSGFVHPAERTCSHCDKCNDCWDEIFERLPLPERFTYRSGWDENRMFHHMRGVVGQVCGNFQHTNADINAQHVRAERRRREVNGEGNDWDEEANQ